MVPTLQYEVLTEPSYVHTQSADGRPHLTYFHTVEHDGAGPIPPFAGGLSFCWSGEPDEPIEVADGGYGEPIRFRITWPTEPSRSPLAEQVAHFHAVCAAWLAQFLGDVIAGAVALT